MSVNDRVPCPQDLRLVQRTLAEDPVAIDRLVTRMVCIPRFLQRMNSERGNRLSVEGVQEASQETFMRIWRDRAGFTGKSRLETWSCGYAKNVYLEAIRDRIQRDERQQSLSDSEPNLAVDLDVPGKLVNRMEADRIREAVDSLDAAAATVVRARLLDGETFAAIAKKTGEHKEALKARYYRAVHGIARSLGEAPSPDPGESTTEDDAPANGRGGSGSTSAREDQR